MSNPSTKNASPKRARSVSKQGRASSIAFISVPRDIEGTEEYVYEDSPEYIKRMYHAQCHSIYGPNKPTGGRILGLSLKHAQG